MRKKRITTTFITNYKLRIKKRSKCWFRSWLFRTDLEHPDLQFARLNPEE